MKNFLMIMLLCGAVSARAQTCPDLPDTDQARQSALLDLANSENQYAGIGAANSVWQIWMQAPDERAQSMLDQGMKLRESYAYAEAETILDGLVSYCPQFAEGWNQRAFVRFLREDFDGAISDIDETLKREPAHFGALSGKAQALLQLGKAGQAKLVIIDALKIHPWLSERALLGPDQKL